MSFDDHENEGQPADTEFDFLAEPEILEPEIEQVQSEDLETSFLHPSSLVFTVISQLKQNIIPAVLALFGAANGRYTFVVIAAVLFVLSIVSAVFRYLTLRYRIQDGELTVQSGLIFRKRRKIPTSKIQNIDLVQNILHRIFGVAEVRIETASGTEPEATLRVLSLKQVALLREKVESATPQSADLRTESSGTASETASTSSIEEILKIPLSWLVKAGLASNRGMVLIGFLIGLFYQNVPDEERALESVKDQIKGLQGFFPSLDSGGWQFWLIAAAALVVLMLLVRLLGVGWFLLRFFGYQLTRVGDDFKISCGLLTKVSATVPLKRIQFISIHRPMIMRWFGLASIRIETAGGAGNAEDATTAVSKRWFIPVVPECEIERLMQIIRPGLPWAEHSFPWKPLAERASSRYVRAAIIFSVLLCGVGFGASQPWGWAPGLVLSPLIVWYAIKRCRNSQFARIDQGVLYRSGVFTRKTSVAFFEKVQGVSLTQTPFDRRWGMKTLTVDTAAAGPANHKIAIRFLDQQLATNEYQEILQRSSGKVED